MRKIFTLAIACFTLWTGNVFAQEEEDVTSYLTNPGFDEDLTWEADGSKKEISSTTTSLSDRSWAYIATDSSLYAVPKSTSSKSRTDGRKDEATNGFIGRIKGWTLTTSTTFPKCEWVYFGSLAYAMGETTVPVADDGTGYLVPPTTKPSGDNGDDNVGVLHLRAGWTNSAAYSQQVNLPCAEYRLEYWVYNANYEGSKDNTGVQNLCQVTCRNDVFADEDGFNAQEWTLHTIEFTPVADFTIQFGFKSSNNGSGSNPYLFIDGIKLYKIGEADEAEILRADIYDLQASLNDMMDTTTIVNYEGLVEDINSAIEAGDDADASGDVDELKAAYNQLKEMNANVQELVKNNTVAQYEALMAQAENLLNTTDYAGKDAFQTSIDEISEKANTAKVTDFASLIDELQKAIETYTLSQEATKDSPADYTSVYFPNPYFTTEANQPTIVYNEDGTVASCTYPLGNDYKTYGNSNGWYKAGTTDGDQRLNTVGERICWNAWRQGSADVAVATDLTDLPNGYYKVSAEMITQPSYVSNQHVYATSTAGSAESSALTEGLWDEGTWTVLTTTDWVIVTDGKLTVGALGSALDGSTDQTGWFCVTNFRLLYGGEVSEEDLKAAYEEQLAEANELANSVYYKADKADFQEAINANSNASTADEISEALANLKTATKTAQASIDKHDAVEAGSLNDLRTKASDGTYATNQATVANLAVEQMNALQDADDATYTEMDSLTTILRYYRDNYLPVLGEAENLELTDATAKEAMQNTIASQIEKFQNMGTLADTETLDEFIEELKNAISVCSTAEAVATDDSDLTSAIINPTCDGSNNTAELDGWSTILKNSGNGYRSTTGQGVDGVSSNRYLDAWNGTKGELRYTVWQTISNIPNGVYEVKAMMRTSGTVGSEGVYLFGYDDTEAAGVDSTALAATYAAAHIQPTDSFYVDNTATKGEVYVYRTDSYGPIWQEAYDAVDTGGGTEEQIAIAEANGGKGRGWFYVSLQVTVTNNTITIGCTNDDRLTTGSTDTDGAACVPFSGEWYSCDNWTLTLIQNNEEDFNPATGVESIISGENVPAAIFSLDGRSISNLNNAPAGIYVVRQQDGTTVKVLKK